MERPTIRQARTAFIASRHIDTSDQISGDGSVTRGTNAFRGRTSLRMALLRLMDKLERVHKVSQDELQRIQRPLEDDPKNEQLAIEVQRQLSSYLDEPLDDATFEELNPQKFGLRISAIGWKVFDRVTTNIWKDLGPWFLQDVPDDEVTEDGNASRSERRAS